jgi:hypothetical protein
LVFLWVFHAPIQNLGNKQCGAEIFVLAPHVDDFISIVYHLFVSSFGFWLLMSMPITLSTFAPKGAWLNWNAGRVPVLIGS